VAMRRRTAAGRDVHVDDAESSGRVLAAQENRVRVSNQTNVWQLPVVGLCNRERAPQIIGGEGRERRRRVG